MYPEVELDLAEMACVPRNIRRTFLVPSLLFQILRHCEGFCTTHFESLAAYQSNDSGLSVRLRILLLETKQNLTL